MESVISPENLSAYKLADKSPIYKHSSASISKTRQFLSWCQAQEEHRILWLALTFLGLIGMAVPCTLGSILTLAGNNFTLWIIVCAVNVPVMAISLAAQPTKVTIPALIAAFSIDLSVILYCVAHYLLN